MSMMGLVTSLGSDLAEREKRPAATAVSSLERTTLSRTGMTPSTMVRSSRMYLSSSFANSRIMSGMVAVARRLLFVRMLRADTMLFALALGIDKTDIKSAWLASLPFLVLLRLTIVPTSEAVTPETVRSSLMTDSLSSEPAASYAGAACALLANSLTEAMVERRLPLLGKWRCTERGRGFSEICSKSTEADEPTDEERAEERAVEATETALASSSFARSSVEMLSRSGEDMLRLLERMCWLLRFAPRRFRVGVAESGVLGSASASASTSDLAATGVAALSSEMTEAGASSTAATLVSIFRS